MQRTAWGHAFTCGTALSTTWFTAAIAFRHLCAMPPSSPPDNRIPPPPPQRIATPALRALLWVFAVLCLALGAIGVFVPGLPTTVFILMAAWASARSSPRLHAWLWYHRLFGPMLRDWAHGGCVSRSAKWSATGVMSLCTVILISTASQRWAAVAGSLAMAVVLAWLWCRPEPAANAPPAKPL